LSARGCAKQCRRSLLRFLKNWIAKCYVLGPANLHLISDKFVSFARALRVSHNTRLLPSFLLLCSYMSLGFGWSLACLNPCDWRSLDLGRNNLRRPTRRSMNWPHFYFKLAYLLYFLHCYTLTCVCGSHLCAFHAPSSAILAESLVRAWWLTTV
jgi:hypothetical protein